MAEEENKKKRKQLKNKDGNPYHEKSVFYIYNVYIYNYILNMLHNIIEKVVKFGTGPHELPDKLLLALLAVVQSSSNPPGRGMKHV